MATGDIATTVADTAIITIADTDTATMTDVITVATIGPRWCKVITPRRYTLLHRLQWSTAPTVTAIVIRNRETV